jgi:hypothetical protein
LLQRVKSRPTYSVENEVPGKHPFLHFIVIVYYVGVLCLNTKTDLTYRCAFKALFELNTKAILHLEHPSFNKMFLNSVRPVFILFYY